MKKLVHITCPKCGHMIKGRLWRCPECGGSDNIRESGKSKKSRQGFWNRIIAALRTRKVKAA
jgi:transposase